MCLLETGVARAVDRVVVRPGLHQAIERLVAIADGRAGEVVAMGRFDRALAVLVDHDTVGLDEPVRVVEVQRPARVALVVDELVRVLDELPRLITEATGPTLDEPKLAALRKARSRQIGVEGDLNVQPPREVVDTGCDEVRTGRRDPLCESCRVTLEIPRVEHLRWNWLPV